MELAAEATKGMTFQHDYFSAKYYQHPSGPVCEVNLFKDAGVIALTNSAIVLDHQPVAGFTMFMWDAYLTPLLFSDMVAKHHKCTYLQWKNRWMKTRVRRMR